MIFTLNFFLEKALQSKVVSKAWSEQDSSDDNDNVKNNLFPKYPSPKKRRMMPKCARMIEKEFSPNLPKPPTTSINSTGNLLFIDYSYLFLL